MVWVGVAARRNAGLLFAVTKGNTQPSSAKNFHIHVMDASRNISTSVSAELGCLVCSTPPFSQWVGRLGRGWLRILFSRTRHFPPILPAHDGNCVVITPVEDGILGKIALVFCDLFTRFLSPGGGGSLPPGECYPSQQQRWAKLLSKLTAMKR